jgi:hypothetical protein
MRLRRHSELPEDRRRPVVSIAPRKESVSPPPRSPSVASSDMPRKRLRKFSETPKKPERRSEEQNSPVATTGRTLDRAERLSCLAAKRRMKEFDEESSGKSAAGSSEDSYDFIASESDSSESNISHSYYANADRELFRADNEINTYVQISGERNFASYLEYVAFALAAIALQVGWSRDELVKYAGVMRKFEKEVFTKRDAALGRWPREMREAIEKFPVLQMSREGYAPGTLCQACNRKGDTVVEGMLSGNFYDTNNFHGRVTDIEKATEAAVKEFVAARGRPFGEIADERVYLTLSAHCAKKVEEYHCFHHWKWRVFQAVYRWLMENRKAFETAADAAVVIKNDSSFLDRMQRMNDELFKVEAGSD